MLAQSCKHGTQTSLRPCHPADTEIHLLTDLTAAEAGPCEAAEAYRTRWTIEGAFQTLTDVLRCEVETLGYPRAALFSFATAVVAWNTYAVVKAALRAAHGREAIDERLSDHHLTEHVVSIQAGLEMAVDETAWMPYQTLTPRRLARQLLKWAKQVDLNRYPKKKRGPKKPKPRSKSGDRNHHISTAKTLAASRQK